MRVTVFGADNDIGRKVVEELIWRGYEPRVFTSDPSTVPETWGRRVQVLSGQLTDPVSVAAAVAGAEAVVNTLDPRLDRPGAHLVEGAARLVAVMVVHGSRQILTFNDADFRRYPQVTALNPRDVASTP